MMVSEDTVADSVERRAEDVTPPGPATWRARALLAFEVMAVIGLLATAFTLRVWQLDESSFWIDEIFTAENYSHSTLGACLENVHAARAKMPLDYVCGFLWVKLTGASTEWGLRFYTVIVGMLTVVGVWLTGRLLAGRWLGLLTLFLITLSPFHIYYSRELRLYGMLALVSALFCLSLLHLLRNRDRLLPPALFALCLLLCAYTHIYTAFFTVPTAIALFLVFLGQWRQRGFRSALKQEGKLWLILLGFGVLVGVLVLPWFIYDILPELRSTGEGWNPVDSQGQGFFSLDPNFHINLLFHLSGSSDIGVIVFSSLVAIALVWGLVRRDVFVLSLAISFPMILLLHSRMSRNYGLILRQYTYLIPIWVTLASVGVYALCNALWSVLRLNWIRVPVVTLLAGAAAWGSVRIHEPGIRAIHEVTEPFDIVREDFRTLGHLLERLVDGTDDPIEIRHISYLVEHYWPEIEEHVPDRSVLSRSEIARLRAEGRHIYILDYTKGAQQFNQLLMDTPHIRLELWRMGWLICIPPDVPDPHQEMVSHIFPAAMMTEPPSCYLSSSLARLAIRLQMPESMVQPLLERSLSAPTLSSRSLFELAEALHRMGREEELARVLEVLLPHFRLQVMTNYQSREWFLYNQSRALALAEDDVGVLDSLHRAYLWSEGGEFFKERLEATLAEADPENDEILAWIQRTVHRHPESTPLWLALFRNLCARQQCEDLIRNLQVAMERSPEIRPDLGPWVATATFWFTAGEEVPAERRASLEQSLMDLILDNGSIASAWAEISALLDEASEEMAIERAELFRRDHPQSEFAEAFASMVRWRVHGIDPRGASLLLVQRIQETDSEDLPELFNSARMTALGLGFTAADLLEEGHANAWTCHLMAQWLERSGFPEEALAAWDCAKISEGRQHAEFDLGRFRILTQLGRTDEARAAAESACTLEPDHPWAHYYLAHAEALQGDLDSAWQHVERSIDLNIDQIGALDLSMNLAMRRGDYSSALSRGEEMLDRTPDDMVLRFNIAQCLLALGHPDQAREMYEQCRGAESLAAHAEAAAALERELGL